MSGIKSGARASTAAELVQPQSATVVIEIWPAPVERQVGDVPVRFRNLASGLRAQLTPSVVRVSIRGNKDQIASLRPDAIQCFVDLAGLGSGRYNLRVQVDPAEAYGATGVDPAVVAVTIR